MQKICSNNRLKDEIENDDEAMVSVHKKLHRSVTNRPNIDEISKRNEEAAKQEKKKFYTLAGIIVLLIIVVIYLVYFFN